MGTEETLIGEAESGAHLPSPQEWGGQGCGSTGCHYVPEGSRTPETLGRTLKTWVGVERPECTHFPLEVMP